MRALEFSLLTSALSRSPSRGVALGRRFLDGSHVQVNVCALARSCACGSSPYCGSWWYLRYAYSSWADRQCSRLPLAS